MPRRKKSLVENPNPPKRRGANRRKAKRDPISEMYAEQERDTPTRRTKRPKKVAASKRKRSGASTKSRGKKKRSRNPRTRRS